MNRNVESHFSLNPSTLDMKRSCFDMSHDLKTTFNAGKLIPIYYEEVLPGDTFNLDYAVTCRMTPSVHPTMDNCYLETFFFFVPNRLVWDHWKEFCGENNTDEWTQETEYSIPQLYRSSGSNWPAGSVWDYMGNPTGVYGTSSALPFRAYALIWNEWFRDQNLQSAAQCSKGDSDLEATADTDYVTGAQKGLVLLPVNKYHDYFTSCLPQPQKNSDVLVPMNTKGAMIMSDFADPSSGLGPVPSGDDPYALPYFYWDSTSNSYKQVYQTSAMNLVSSNAIYRSMFASANDPSYDLPRAKTNVVGTSSYSNSVASGTTVNPGVIGTDTSTGKTAITMFPYYADLSQAGATINQLRMAFQIQKFYEKQALYGSRYTEIVRSFFGTISPDARLQRPEYLGGNRTTININQVVQTSSTDSVSPQANVAAYSLTNAVSRGFRQSFTEHGMILGFACVRTDHTYQQGMARSMSRVTKFDYYWPVFSNIGNQAVLRKELYSTGDPDNDNVVFGYQEAWADYRYHNNYVTGQFRSNATGTLDSWHYADNYAAAPTLTDAWIRETDVNVNRTLAISSSVSDQFIADFAFKNTAYRVMPVYSIPGLIDHH